MSNIRYKVLDAMKIGDNTSVTIEGKGEELHNQMLIFDTDNVAHTLLSVAMPAGQAAEDIGNQTILLIEGEFKSESVNV